MRAAEFFLPSRFKTELPDPTFPLQQRFDEHRVRSFTASYVGDKIQNAHVVRVGRLWQENGNPCQVGEPLVALVTPRSLTVEIRDIPSLQGGNDESGLARALAANPQTVLRETYDRERAYHLIPLDGRRALVFSVKKSDVQRVIVDAARSSTVLAHVFCGMAVATKLALADQASRFPDASAIVVNDQNSALTLTVRSGRIDGAPQLLNVREGDLSRAELLKVLRKAAHQREDDGARQVLIYATARSVFATAPDIAVPDLVTEYVRQTSADLCFA